MSSDTNLQKRVKLLQWSIPVGLLFISIIYQFGLARWVHDNYHENAHFLVEIFFYGFIGPLIVYFAFNNVLLWLSEKEQAEKAARDIRQNLVAITEASADAIIGLTVEGVIISWNRGAKLILGYSDAGIQEKSFDTLLADEKNAKTEWAWLKYTVTKKGFIQGYETSLKKDGGSPVAIELTASQITDGDRETTGFSLILRDITERKKREAEIKALNTHLNDLVVERTEELDRRLGELAQANEQLKQLDQTRMEFVSVVSHQIRAPLTNIRGAVEKLQFDGRSDRDMLVIVEQQAERLDRLVRGVLSADKIEAGNLVLQTEPTSLYPLLNEAVAQFQSRDQSHLIEIPTQSLPLVEADADRVLEVLTNLLDNASKYSPAKSEITISAQTKDTEVVLSVMDQGKGVSNNDLEHVFEKFYRSDSSDSQVAYGYGLGLYICRQLVEAMQGKIWIENHPEAGAIFSFSLPIWQETYGQKHNTLN